MYDRSSDTDAGNSVWSQIADIAADEKCLEMATIFMLPTGARTVHERRAAQEFVSQKMQPMVAKKDFKWFVNHQCSANKKCTLAGSTVFKSCCVEVSSVTALLRTHL